MNREVRLLSTIITAVTFATTFALINRWLRPGVRLHPGDIIKPQAVSHIASTFPQNELDFVLSCWDFVATEIEYQPIISDVDVLDSIIQCGSGCTNPISVLNAGKANCFGSSILLVSLLRNKLPPERVFMALGELRKNGTGGHAWCIAHPQFGSWYTLEATLDKLPENPWVPYPHPLYIDEVLFNDRIIEAQPGVTVHLRLDPCYERC